MQPIGPNPYAQALYSNGPQYAWPVRPGGLDPYAAIRYSNGAPQGNPVPYAYAQYRNPLSFATKVFVTLVALAALGGGAYYIAKKSGGTKGAPPLAPHQPPTIPGSLGVFAADEVVAMPDPVVFVLRPGESFDIDFGAPNVIGRVIEDYDTAPNTDELVVTSLDAEGKISEPFTAQVMRVGVPPTWGTQSAGAFKISPRGMLDVASAKQIWVTGSAGAMA